ncbi:hypothetical protein [Arachidicoccus sp.]|uniref:hypothetical protein n=1 Tax=Arachidicoccus sp. TaxID=1872624 RepID=UPI003D24351E
MAQVKSDLTILQLAYINIHSIENFFQYFDDLKEEHKPVIIEKDDFLIDKDASKDI